MDRDPSRRQSRTVRKVGPSTYSITNQMELSYHLHVHQPDDTGMLEVYERCHLPFKTDKRVPLRTLHRTGRASTRHPGRVTLDEPDRRHPTRHDRSRFGSRIQTSAVVRSRSAERFTVPFEAFRYANPRWRHRPRVGEVRQGSPHHASELRSQERASFPRPAR